MEEMQAALKKGDRSCPGDIDLSWFIKHKKDQKDSINMYCIRDILDTTNTIREYT